MTPAAGMAPRLHRHQLAWLSSAGWQRVLARDLDAQARACLAHWAGLRLPVVVTRQPAAAEASGEIAVGLSAPQRWGRRRLALRVQPADVLGYGDFPCLAELVAQLPSTARAPLARLATWLSERGVAARVHGSHGWAHLTGLDHVHAGSDLDLCCAVADAGQADATAAALAAIDIAPLRLDGELMFADGAAVAWREWQAWRAGRTAALLVKRLDGAAIESDLAGLAGRRMQVPA